MTAMRVLIVDDEPYVRRFLRRCLEGEGVDVIQAASAEEALEIVEREGAPAIAFCDLRLPGRDGLWLAKQLSDGFPETAVVMSTGAHDFEVAVRSLQTGVVDYLLKPCAPPRVSEALSRASAVYKERRALTAIRQELTVQRTQISDVLAEAEMTASGSVKALVTMIEGRPAGAESHAYRVARLAVNLALTLKVGEPALSDIERAALLHDLGQPSVDETMQPPIAILAGVSFLSGAVRIAAAVHRQCDGSVRYQPLSGNGIPLGARIIRVANAHDELVAGAAGAAVSPERATEILRTDRSWEFDPGVLRALELLHPPSVAA